ncbi:MAG: DUF4783 domain-containing protein [Bacteroidia bacterium]
MKQFNIYLFILITSFPFVATAQADILEDITSAIRTGNSREVSRLFNSSVELTILTDENVYSKTQAEMILKDFFSNHQPTSFKIIHTGSSAKGCKYAIGNLVTNNGAFRTYFFIKEINGSLFIQQLRFEKE